ncbi:PDZ and LIM domain 7 [Brachionus plicatilis]|uniref:PDZ and LIM domain 7 n=1 Tax=Brachionus plicatilis TaxID=10195 RepID=A0A3M7SLY1_BRAPC|nr:PDZ and LIM domain 7 [Brachionus plicatilis]
MYSCYECNEVINGQFTTANGRSFHPQCFKCESCKCNLTNFFTHNGRFLCSNCFSEAALPRCSNCNKVTKIGENYMTVNGKVLHRECFRCEGPCQSPINGRFFSIRSKNVCQNCYSKYGDDFEKFLKKEEPVEPKKEAEIKPMINRVPIYF